MTDNFPAPSSSGVYLFKGPRDEVLYVGKSRNLKRRVLDHLNVRAEKDARLVGKYAKVEFLPTRNEQEALLLEANLAKELQPRYNVLLKDDKSFPYIQVTTGEAFPRISLVRRPRRSGKVTLFGPYTSARAAMHLVKVLEDSLHTRRCVVLPKRECIYYHMGLCPAPCIGAISEEDYGKSVQRALLVLKGKQKEVGEWLENEMQRAANRQEFERAAVLRDARKAIEALREKQRVTTARREEFDLLAIHFPKERREWARRTATISLLRVRGGQVIGAERRLLSIPRESDPVEGELLSTFLLQDYSGRSDLPGRLYLPPIIPKERGDLKETEDHLSSERGIDIRLAKKGRPRALMELALKAAEAYTHVRQYAEPHEGAAEALKKLLRLQRPPRRIEGIDISNLSGGEAVGSLVVFNDNRPAKNEYRRYKIGLVDGPDDPAMVKEVVGRRLRRLISEGIALPDLLLIDGGAGQVSRAVEAMREAGLNGSIPILGLAKRDEALYLPGKKAPLRLDRNSPPMLLLRHVRDEAHRFAIAYHHKRRQMSMDAEKEFATNNEK